MQTNSKQTPWEEAYAFIMQTPKIEEAARIEAIKVACEKHADQLRAELEAIKENIFADRPNGEWLDRWGSCRICEGEIPHGHSENCDYFKLERQLDTLRREYERTKAEFEKAIHALETANTMCTQEKVFSRVGDYIHSACASFRHKNES